MNTEDYYLDIQRNGGQANYPLGQQDSQGINPDSGIYAGPILPKPILPAPPVISPYARRSSFSLWRMATVVIPMLIIVAASIALAYYTGYWLLVIILPTLAVAAALSSSLRLRPAPLGGYLAARLVAALIGLSIIAVFLTYLLCRLNGVF